MAPKLFALLGACFLLACGPNPPHIAADLYDAPPGNGLAIPSNTGVVVQSYTATQDGTYSLLGQVSLTRPSSATGFYSAILTRNSAVLCNTVAPNQTTVDVGSQISFYAQLKSGDVVELSCYQTSPDNLQTRGSRLMVVWLGP